VPIVEAGAPAGPLLNGLNAVGNALWQGIQTEKLTELNAKQAREIVKKGGLSQKSYSYALKNLLAHKLIKKTPEIGRYIVTGAKS
jgi:hypothetical protein